MISKYMAYEKLNLTIAIKFISFRDDNDEECVMHSKINNVEIVFIDEADEVIEENFNSL